MTSIIAVTLETADPAAGRRFYSDTFGPHGQVRLRAGGGVKLALAFESRAN